MIEEAVRDLIDRDIEGEIAAEDRARLAAVLRDRPEVRAYYERMVSVARALENPRLAEPPAGLRESVLGEIAARDRVALTREGWFARLAGLFAGPRLRYALVGAAGIAVGVLGAGLALDGRVGPPVPRDQSAGALVAGRPNVGSAVDTRDFTLPDASGTVRLVPGSDSFFLEIAITSVTTSHVEATCDPASALLPGFLFDAPGEVDARSAPGRLELSHAGNVTYRIAVRRVASAPARLAWRIRTVGGETEGFIEVPVVGP